MKKRNLFIANTYFQLITSINLAIHQYKNDDNDIIVTNIAGNIDSKIDNIKKINIFKNVYFLKAKHLITRNKVKKYLIYLKYLFKNDYIDLKIKYDELLFYNYNVVTYSVFDNIIKNNKDLICSKFDEGIATYTINVHTNKFYHLTRTLFLRKNIDKYIKNLYLYHPELICYKNNYQLKKIAILDKNDKNLREILNIIFNYQREEIKEKYIYLEEGFFCDGYKIDDFELVKDISKVVGKENLIVKLHPRNKINRFEKEGIKTWKNSGMPWEIIQMNEDYSEKVLLTISSSGLLSSKLQFDEDIKAYYLFNCTNIPSPYINSNFYEYLNNIEKNIGLKNIVIPNNKIEFLKTLSKNNERKRGK